MPDPQQHTLLVVDDNQDNRDLIRRRLERAGYNILLAEDGPRALERVASEAIDLVVLDVMMPGMSGIEVLSALRETHSAAELPVIMATAKDQSEDVVEALEHGANDYVTKPLDFPVILARIQAQLRAREAAASKPSGGEGWGAIARLEPGVVLAGNYKLEEKLGAGNFGMVFRATHLGFQQPVAVKVLQTSVDDSPESLERFRQEGMSSFRLKHPNVVSVLDFQALEGGQAFLVMELLEGHSLDVELRLEGAMSPRRCGEIILPVCEGLAEAHSLGIVHRDIKPANIFLQRTHRGETVKVLDFGIAKLVGDAAVEKNLTLDEAVLGTPAYLAPERLSGADYDGRADVYALGVVLYQMLAGYTPFRSEGKEAIAVAMMHIIREPEPLQTYMPGAWPSLEAVVMRALAKNPVERPTATELARELKAALQEAPRSQPAPRAGSSESVTRQMSPLRTDVSHRGDRDPRPSLDFDLSHLLEPPGGTEPGPPVAIFAPRRLSDPWS